MLISKKRSLFSFHNLSSICSSLCLFTGIVILTLLIFLSNVPLNHDCGLLLQCAQLILKGNILYVDFIGTNPPLSYYIHIIPVLISQWFHTDLPSTFLTTVLLFVIYSTTSIFFILKKNRLYSRSSEIKIICTIIVLFSIYSFSRGDFGQRDHLFLLGYLPWFFLREAKYRGIQFNSYFSLIVGLLCSIVTLLKPHFLLILIGIECWSLLRTRYFKLLKAPEFMVLIISSFLYTLHFALIPSVMYNAYFHQWLPFVIKHYQVYNNPVHFGIFPQVPQKLFIATCIFLCLGVLFRYIHKKKYLLFESSILSSILGMGIYLIQQKGWPYHLFPFIGFLLNLIAIIYNTSITIIEKYQTTLSKILKWIFFSIFFILINVSYYYFIKKTHRHHSQRMVIDEFVNFIEQHTVKTDRITFLNTSVAPGFPALNYANRLTGAKFNIAFPIPMLYKDVTMKQNSVFPYHPLNKMPKEEIEFLEASGTNILNIQPKLIFIHNASPCQACPNGFNINEYLSTVGWLEKYLDSYRYHDHIFDFVVYKRFN